MKAIKRTVAAILATLMLATSTSFSLAAETLSAKEAEAIGKVSAAGIMVGDENGDFMADDTLTREQAAKIIVVMKGISESAVKAAAGTTMFDDVEASSWASGYINQASKLGIVKGVSATSFAPKKEVTIQEFVTMAIRALGAGQLVDAEGTWPNNYVNFANENKLLDDVNSLPSNNAKRIEAAMIVKNTLYTEMWKKEAVKTNGEITWGPADEYILRDVLELTETLVTPQQISTKEHTIDGVDVREDFDLTSIKAGITYHAYKNKDGEIQGLWIEDDTVEFTAIAKDYDDVKDKLTLTVDGKDKEYKVLDDTAYIIYNEQVSASTTIADLEKDKDVFGSITVNDKNEIVTVAVYQYNYYGVVDEVTKSVVKFDSSVKNAAYESQIKFTTEDNEYILTKDGKAISYADLEEGDAIRWYVVEEFDGSHDRYVGEIIKPIEGTVTATGEGYIKLDKVKYDLVDGVSGLKTNDEVEVYLNNAGKIIMAADVKSEDNDEVAIVKYIKPTIDKYMEQNFEVKLFLMDGTTTDALSVDLEETYEEFFDCDTIEDDDKLLAINQILFDDDTPEYFDDLDEVEEEITSTDKEKVGYALASDALDVLGALICYEINGDKLTILPSDAEDFTIVPSAEKIKVTSKNVFIADEDDEAICYITKNTVIYNIKEDKDYQVKVESVDVDSLDDTPITDDCYVVGYDFDDNSREVDYVILYDESIKRTTETNFAFVTEVSNTKYKNKKAFEVTVLDMNGKEASYIYAEAEAEEEDLDDILVPGALVDLSVDGELIMNADVLNSDPDDKLTDESLASLGTAAFLADVVGNRILLEGDDDTKEFFYSDDVLVLAKDAKGKYKVKDLDDIKEVDWDADEFDNNFVPTVDDYSEDIILNVWTYNDGTDKEAVVIVYMVASER